MNNPLISIIVPVYNGEKYIEKCIDSILKQDYHNIEIIIVNDGSKDNSKKIIEEMKEKDNRIIFINREEPSGGPSTPRNMALDISKGEYIFFVDQDDYIYNNCISYLYSLIDKTKADISLTYTAEKFVGDLDYNKTVDVSDYYNVVDNIKAVENMLYYKYIISPWSKLIKSSIIKDNNIKFNTNFFSGEGFLFAIECLYHSKNVVEGNSKVYLYRLDNDQSGMTKYSDFVINSSIKAQNEIREYLKNENDSIKKAYNYSNWHTHCDCYNQIIGCKMAKKRKELYKEIKKVVKKDSLKYLKCPLKFKDKIKMVLYFINPYVTSRLINKFRKRKFTVEK